MGSEHSKPDKTPFLSTPPSDASTCQNTEVKSKNSLRSPFLKLEEKVPDILDKCMSWEFSSGKGPSTVPQQSKDLKKSDVPTQSHTKSSKCSCFLNCMKCQSDSEDSTEEKEYFANDMVIEHAPSSQGKKMQHELHTPHTYVDGPLSISPSTQSANESNTTRQSTSNVLSNGDRCTSHTHDPDLMIYDIIAEVEKIFGNEEKDSALSNDNMMANDVNSGSSVGTSDSHSQKRKIDIPTYYDDDGEPLCPLAAMIRFRVLQGWPERDTPDITDGEQPNDPPSSQNVEEDEQEDEEYHAMLAEIENYYRNLEKDSDSMHSPSKKFKTLSENNMTMPAENSGEIAHGLSPSAALPTPYRQTLSNDPMMANDVNSGSSVGASDSHSQKRKITIPTYYSDDGEPLCPLATMIRFRLLQGWPEDEDKEYTRKQIMSRVSSNGDYSTSLTNAADTLDPAAVNYGEGQEEQKPYQIEYSECHELIFSSSTDLQHK